VLAGDRKDVLLLDVTPLTLGIETEGGVLTPLIERNTTIPAERKNTFSTAADGQTAVTVRVFQGERKMAAHNRLLGEFNLEGIPAAPRGVPQIEVKFDIDQNGILNVSAREMGSGKEASVKIQQSSGLSKAEIESMQRDAEEHAEEDRRQFELAEARNKAQHLTYELEKQMKENADKLSESDREPLNAAIAKVRKAAETTDTESIKSATNELEQAAQAFSKVLYEKASASASAGAASAPAGNDDEDAIDAEFEVKKD
jgi:molecular chaperone DnaK